MTEVYIFATLVVGGIFINEYVKVGGDPLLLVLLFGSYTLMVATANSNNKTTPSAPSVVPEPVKPPVVAPPAVVPPVATLSCGKQSTIPQNYIIGGSEAYPGKWPWMVYIAKTLPTGTVEQSAGFLINERWVVTCAHTSPDKTMSVTLGVFDLSQQETTRIVASVEKIIIHPNFNAGTVDSNYQLNDIALIKLSGPVTFTPYIQPICLPTSLQDPGTGGNLKVCGWGLDETLQPSDKLKDVSLTVVSNPVCANFFKGFTGNGQLCLGNLDKIASDCKGDSGGPVMTQKGTTWTAVGIVSYGFVDCANLSPSVYTDVAFHLDFIKKSILL